MLLDDAYQALGLKPPWDHEDRVRERHDARFAKRLGVQTQQSYDRAIGSTQHMLIELYLDIERANRTVNPMNVGKITFLLVCLNRDMAEELKRKLTFLHSQLNLYVNVDQVRFLPHNMLETLRGVSKIPSWGIFCDNSVKENVLDLDRPSGPFRYIRKLQATKCLPSVGGHHSVTTEWEAFDRDDNLVCTLPNLEINEILKGSECPIVMGITTGGLPYEPVAYPAWSEEPLNHLINYRTPFKV